MEVIFKPQGTMGNRPSSRRQNQGRRRIKSRRPSGKLGKALLILMPLVLVPFILQASVLKGRFYISDYFSRDSGSFDFHVLTSALKLFNADDNKPGVSFTLDGRVRKKINNGDIHQDIPEYKFNELWMGYRFPDAKLSIKGGRQYIEEMYNTSIDGINVKYAFGNGFGMGIFGGLAPDKYDYSFNADFRSVGLYGFLDRDNYQLMIGYENLNYKGDTDREYVSLKLFADLSKDVRFNVISSASINQMTNSFQIENINANLAYRYSKNLRISTFYNYYRAIRYFASSKQFFDSTEASEDYFLDTNSQTRTGVRVDYRIMKGLKVYGSAAYQLRKIDNEDALRLTGGFRKYDLLGFDVSGRYTYINNFTSKSSEFNVEISRHLFDLLDLSLYASHESEKLDIENGFTSGILTYGASLYWPINRHFYASMFIEHYDEDDYNNTSIFSQIGYRL